MEQYPRFNELHRDFIYQDYMKNYPIKPEVAADLVKRFTYHAPKPDQPERYELLRNKALELATLIVELSPSSREQSVALTLLDQVIMETNAAIARNE